jgi:Kef-type K+ transport system membrane component KefB
VSTTPSLRFFRRAVWLPLFVPWPHAIWYYGAEVRPAHLDWMNAFGLSVVHGLLYTGFTLILLRRERDADERRALRVLWLAPAIYAPILAVVLLVLSVLMQVARGVRPSVAATLSALGIFLVGALLVGYALAGVIHLWYVGLGPLRWRSPRGGPKEERGRHG